MQALEPGPKAKGSIIVEFVKFLRKHRAQALQVLPQECSHYLSSKVLVASWYPERDVVALARACAKVRGSESPETYRYMGRLSAESHTTGLYNSILGQQAERLHRKAQVRGCDGDVVPTASWELLHDSGELCYAMEGPGRLRYELRNYGAPSREMCEITHGYLERFLETAGLRNVRVAKVACTLDGSESCVWDCRFDVVETDASASTARSLSPAGSDDPVVDGEVSYDSSRPNRLTTQASKV